MIILNVRMDNIQPCPKCNQSNNIIGIGDRYVKCRSCSYTFEKAIEEKKYRSNSSGSVNYQEFISKD